MRHYKFYPFSREGRLLDAVEVDLENDVRAIRCAIDPDFPNGCELWEGFRFIGRFHGAATEDGPMPSADKGAATLVH